MALGFQAYTNTGDRGFCTSGKGTTFSRAVQSVSPWSGTAGSRALPDFTITTFSLQDTLFDPGFNRFPHLAQPSFKKMIRALDNDQLLGFVQTTH